MIDLADAAARTPFQEMVAGRFGILPNFFRSGRAAPGLIEQLWKFALSAYLDNPLPSLFKERLFVSMSQFCTVRYCIIRHVGFLAGLGHPLGDAEAPVQTIAQIVSLLQRPRPDMDALQKALIRLSERTAPSAILEADTPLERDLFDVLTLLFLAPLAMPRVRAALRATVGDRNFEYLVAFLAFIRTAHYWTETHPEIEIEADMQALMQANADLARLLLNQNEPA